VAALGAHVVKDGVTSSTIAFERAAELQRRDGLTLVHPFDDPYVIAGAIVTRAGMTPSINPPVAGESNRHRPLDSPSTGGRMLVG